MNKIIDRLKTTHSFFVFTRRELIFIISIFILGIILGATIMTVVTGKYIDELVLKNNELETRIKDQEQQLGQLDKQFKNKMVVQKIVPSLDTDLNKHTQQEIIKKIRKLLGGLLSKDISDVDPLLLRDIINEASIIVEEHAYHLHLSYLVISDELRLYLQVNEEQDNKSEE